MKKNSSLDFLFTLKDASTLMNLYANDPTIHEKNYYLCTYCLDGKSGGCEISPYREISAVMSSAHPKTRRLQQEEKQHNHDD
jgi:hypothetical protein